VPYSAYNLLYRDGRVALPGLKLITTEARRARREVAADGHDVNVVGR
jgi:hypothetical protein